MSGKRNLEFSPRNPDGEQDSLRTVEIIQVQDSQKEPQVLVRCELVDGVVQLAGDEAIIRELQEEEFFWAGEKVTPADGENFLQAVKASYHNPYLYARKVN